MKKTVKNVVTKDQCFWGSTKIEDSKFTDLTIFGGLSFSNLTILNDSNVIGSVQNARGGNFHELCVLGAFEGENITCSSLDIMGPTKIKGLKVLGETNIAGSLEIRASQDSGTKNILQDIEISGNDIILEDTHVLGSITIHPKFTDKFLHFFKKSPFQNLKLLGSTIVKGDITFVSGKGKLTLGPNVKIEGHIKGAVLE